MEARAEAECTDLAPSECGKALLGAQWTCLQQAPLHESRSQSFPQKREVLWNSDRLWRAGDDSPQFTAASNGFAFYRSG